MATSKSVAVKFIKSRTFQVDETILYKRVFSILQAYRMFDYLSLTRKTATKILVKKNVIILRLL